MMVYSLIMFQKSASERCLFPHLPQFPVIVLDDGLHGVECHDCRHAVAGLQRGVLVVRNTVAAYLLVADAGHAALGYRAVVFNVDVHSLFVTFSLISRFSPTPYWSSRCSACAPL